MAYTKDNPRVIEAEKVCEAAPNDDTSVYVRIRFNSSDQPIYGPLPIGWHSSKRRTSDDGDVLFEGRDRVWYRVYFTYSVIYSFDAEFASGALTPVSVAN